MHVFLIVMKCSIEISFSAMIVTLQFWLLLHWGTLLVVLCIFYYLLSWCAEITLPAQLLFSSLYHRGFSMTMVTTSSVCRVCQILLHTCFMAAKKKKSAEPSILKSRCAERIKVREWTATASKQTNKTFNT